MAVAIDTMYVAQHLVPSMQNKLDRKTGGVRRFQIRRVCAYATVVRDDSTLHRQWNAALDSPSLHSDLAEQRALAWQADADDDLDELEVLHHLQQQAAMSPFLAKAFSRIDRAKAATTLVASVLSPSINARTLGRLLSSFDRISLRYTQIHIDGLAKNSLPRGRTTTLAVTQQSAMEKSLPILLRNPEEFPFTPVLFPRFLSCEHPIVRASPNTGDHLWFLQLQVDVVDLFSHSSHPTSRPRKRRRTAFNPFLQVSDSAVVEDKSPGDHLPHAKRYNGVRHRPDRRTWVAEMKPSKHKNKQDFGNFKSEAQAARAVDAAFHHYGRPHLLNFPDTSPQFLSTRPSADAGLDEKAKLRFVKEEAKWLASIAANSSLVSPPTNSLPFQLPELSASSRDCPSARISSFSEISSPFSCGGPEEGDDAVPQSQQGMHLDSLADIVTVGVQNMEPNLGRGSMQIKERGWDGAEDSTLAAVPNVMSPSVCEMQSKWLDSLIRSPPAPMYSMAPSPSHFEDDIALALLEQQSLQG